MRTKDEILSDINEGVPKNIDWYAGAMRYIEAALSKYDRDDMVRYTMTKPLYRLASENFDRGLEEAVHYQYNFTNALQLLKIPVGARVMDVACGAGWLAHFMTRMGYEAYGFDIAADFVDLARQRLGSEPNQVLARAM